MDIQRAVPYPLLFPNIMNSYRHTPKHQKDKAAKVLEKKIRKKIFPHRVVDRVGKAF